MNELVILVQVAYLSKKLQAAKADFTAADEARRTLAQRDREAAATMANMHRDMAGHVVRRRPLKALRPHAMTCMASATTGPFLGGRCRYSWLPEPLGRMYWKHHLRIAP